MGRGEKRYFVQNILSYIALSTLRKVWGKRRPGQPQAHFSRQQKGEVRFIFSKSSSTAAWTALEMQELILRHEIYMGLFE